MPQQTDDWHRALQGTPPQIDLKAKIQTVTVPAPYHAAFTPVSFVGTSMQS